jgi:hypothetical protein
VCKPSSSIIASHTVRPIWPRYGKLLEVVDANWQNHKVSEETRHLDAQHAWPGGTLQVPNWIYPLDFLPKTPINGYATRQRRFDNGVSLSIHKTVELFNP